MRLTTKGRFAVTAMLDLAMHTQTGSGAISLLSISERQGISLSYLEQLFCKLRRAGLVDSIRGPGGGYVLGKKAVDINIADIVCAAEDTLDATQCGGEANCQGGQACLSHDLWAGLNKAIDDHLRSITLERVLSDKEHKMREQCITVS